MAFSPDGRLLAAQGGSPEWNLVLWVWEKSKVVTSVKTTNAAGNPVYQVRTGVTSNVCQNDAYNTHSTCCISASCIAREAEKQT
jgi:hypothetical protein